MQLNKDTYSGYRAYPEKVLQFGGGNFLRCFADWMLHHLNKNGLLNGAAVVVQPTPNGRVDLLNEQDGLFTVYLHGLVNGLAQSTHEVINVVSRGINPYKEFEAFLQTAENPDMRFVISNTTEAGIVFNENDKPTDAPPASFPGKLAVWLYHRCQVFNGDESKGVHVVPCELIEQNGGNLKRIVERLAATWHYEASFTKWLNTACTFSNTLVDRIVPGFPRDRTVEMETELGYRDTQVVEGEPYHFWAMEAPRSLQQELPFPSVGLNVLYTSDIAPYRTRKVRILNGAHTVLVPVAYLCGIDTVREAVEDPAVGRFLRHAIAEEIIPTLDLPKEELQAFAAEVIDRFRNPYIKHWLMSIALNSWSKFAARVLPSILEYKNRTGYIPQRLAFSLAATIAFYKGKRGEEVIALKDDLEALNTLNAGWQKYDNTDSSLGEVVRLVLGFEKAWKMDLNNIEGLLETVTKHLIRIEKNGMANAIANLE